MFPLQAIYSVLSKIQWETLWDIFWKYLHFAELKALICVFKQMCKCKQAALCVLKAFSETEHYLLLPAAITTTEISGYSF